MLSVHTFSPPPLYSPSIDGVLVVTIQNFSTGGPALYFKCECPLDTCDGNITLQTIWMWWMEDLPRWGNRILLLSATLVPHSGSLPKAIRWALWYGFLLDLECLTAFCKDNTFQWQLSTWYLQWHVLDECRDHSVQVDSWPWSSRSWLSISVTLLSSQSDPQVVACLWVHAPDFGAQPSKYERICLWNFRRSMAFWEAEINPRDCSNCTYDYKIYDTILGGPVSHK